MPSPENNTPKKNAPKNDAQPVERTQEMSASLLAAALSKSLPTPDSPGAPNEISDDALAGTATPSGPEVFEPSRPPRSPLPVRLRPYWRWLLALGMIAAIPLVLTLIGALTSPPHIKGIPTGHFVYLEADSPSEKTTTLRGLYLTDPSGASRLLTHEYEPQDTDGGVREWITQPALSPDGTRLAFEKQLISLQEESQTVDNQIWVMDLTPGTSKLPRMVIDLTAEHLKQIVGLAWDSDSSVVFLEDQISYSVATDAPDVPLRTPLDLGTAALAVSPDISATRSPSLSSSGAFAFSAETATGPSVVLQKSDGSVPGPPSRIFALDPTGDKIAFVPPGGGSIIRVFNVASGDFAPDIPVRWGWSAFGKRQITSLRWSPDCASLAFTVSKPPVPDDEIFVVGPDGKTLQLPYRTGRAAWDWGK